ncbi:transporter [Reichenbachiella sp. MALMAid0571]|uniref:transporter n=1 Tax=Reichenbachiella sp. MALMAid0571 TaxID=3143939 RepID=UPI0032DEAB9B
MSDLEFDVLDELYFVIHYTELLKSTDLEDSDLKPILMKIYNKGWIKCFSEPDVELDSSSVDLEVNFRNYFYLASKEGLKAHNKN